MNTPRLFPIHKTDFCFQNLSPYHFEGLISNTDLGVSTHAFTFYKYADDNHQEFKALGWIPPGLEDFLSERLMGESSNWQELLDYQKRASSDEVSSDEE